MKAALEGGLTVAELSGVTTIQADSLELLRLKLNFAAEACRKKTGMTGPADYLATLGVRNTNQFVQRLNMAVTYPKLPLPQGGPIATLMGPRLLDHFIDYLWLTWITPVKANMIKHYSLMEDPAQDGGPQGQMLSITKHGFNKLGVCFRGDTRSFDEFDENGFCARYSNAPGHPYHVPEAYGTVAARSMAFDKVGNDFVNQTGVCVARNILGSMKFVGSRKADDPTEVLNRSGYMFALKFDTGVDTERMQLDKIASTNGPRTVLWRAGEKAAYKIPKRNFLASCRFEVDNPYHTDVNPVFKFRRLTPWVFHRSPAVGERAYVLSAASNIEEGKWYEFTRAHDWASG
jgi:hypothetical protein